MELEGAVVFAILMGQHGGILGKSLSYVVEKLGACEVMESPWELLDGSGREEFDLWMVRCGWVLGWRQREVEGGAAKD